MREIKFRVWGKTEKQYIMYPFAWLSVSDNPDGLVIEDNEDLVIEQYTGDKDQYNTPIYEGDIIQICETDIGEVLQDYDGRWIILGIPKEKLRDGDSVLLGNLEKLQKWCLADILSKEYCSVIGNIHENGDLLNKEEE